MAKGAKGRKRKGGPRTKNGRLSRAYKSPELRDQGTFEAQAKRRAKVGEDADITLAATVPGILFARGFLDKDQYAEALEYRRLRCILYGNPWPGFAGGSEPTDQRIAAIKSRFERKVRRLTSEQKQVITNVCVFDVIPTWFFAIKLRLMLLPEDRAEQEALLSGLNAMVGTMERKAA